MSYTAHVFVCTNRKDGKPCCADKGAEGFRSRLKDWAKQEFGKNVRINACGCLDKCSEGIAAVIYPQNIWFTQLKSGDDEVIKEKLRELFKKN